MPPENRSSNREMVSVPPCIGLEPLVGLHYPAQCRSCGWVGSSEELTEDDAQCTRDIGDRLCLGDCDELERHDLLNIIQAMAAPHPHPDPIAWMVGTAFWWTKEEAERDAAAMGLPVVPLGPMGGSGNPSAWLNTATGAVTTSAVQVMDWDDDGEPVQSLYTHADPAEVERLRGEIRRLHEAGEFLDSVNQGIEDKLRAQLAEAQALLLGFCNRIRLITGDVLRLAREDDFATSGPIRNRAYEAMDHAQQAGKFLSASPEPEVKS